MLPRRRIQAPVRGRRQSPQIYPMRSWTSDPMVITASRGYPALGAGWRDFGPSCFRAGFRQSAAGRASGKGRREPPEGALGRWCLAGWPRSGAAGGQRDPRGRLRRGIRGGWLAGRCRPRAVRHPERQVRSRRPVRSGAWRRRWTVELSWACQDDPVGGIRSASQRCRARISALALPAGSCSRTERPAVIAWIWATR